MPGSAWRSAWSCTGLFSRRTDPKPLRLRPPTRRRNKRWNSDVFKCRPFTFSAWTYMWKRGSAWRSAWSCTGLFSRRTDPKPHRLRPQSRRRKRRQNSDVFKCRPFTCSLNVFVNRRSVWRSAWSCTGLFSRRTDLKPLRLRPPTRRRNSRMNRNVFKCRPFTCSVWTCSWMPGSAWRSAWSCTGLFFQRTDPKPLRLRPPIRETEHPAEQRRF